MAHLWKTLRAIQYTLKRLPVMFRYLAAFVVVMALSLWVTVHDEQDSNGPTTTTRVRHNEFGAPQAAGQPNDAGRQTYRRPALWHRLFTWPEGVEDWALFLTLFAIAEQSQFTRKAAEESAKQVDISKQALVAQFRPKIVIRSMRLDPDRVLYYDRRPEKKWTLRMQIHNVGGTTAHVLKCEGLFQTYEEEKGSPKDIIAILDIRAPFDLPAGAQCPLNLEIAGAKFRQLLRLYEDISRKDSKAGDFLAYHGTITYRDENCVYRQTGFSRNFYIRTAKFLPSDNPEDEFSD